MARAQRSILVTKFFLNAILLIIRAIGQTTGTEGLKLFSLSLRTFGFHLVFKLLWL